MEASQADAGQQPQEAPQAQGEEQAAPDPVLQRVEELSQQVQQLQQQPDDDPEAGLDEEGYDDEYGPEGEQDAPAGVLYNEFGEPVDPQTGQVVDPDEQDAQALQQMIDQQIDQRVNQAIKPLLEQQQEQRVMQDAEALEQEFPELATPEVAEPTVERARRIAEDMGQPELSGDPKFIRLAYLAGKAEQLAAQETPAGSTPEAVQIEGGGGAVPQQPDEDDPAMAIVRAGRPSGNVLGGLS